MKKIIFPDASVFLHFVPLGDFDLPRLFNCAEVELLLTLIVMEELVHHQRDHPILDMQQRAKEKIRQVEKWLEGQQAIGPGIEARFLDKQPDSEMMKRHHLNWQHQDDLLLGMILEYKQVFVNQTAILLTGDSDLAARARSLGIEAEVLSSEYALTEAINVLPSRKQKLRQQLTALRYRTSSLLPSFVGGKDEITVILEPQLDSLTATMQAQLMAVTDNMRLEALHHQMEDMAEAAFDDLEALADLVVQTSLTGRGSFLGRMAQEEAKRHQREIAAYPEKFERYLHRCVELINEHRRTIRLDLEVQNTGGAQAENVLLVLTVPEHLEWYWQPGKSKMPAPPAPPSPPGSEGQLFEKGFHIGRVSAVPSHFAHQDTISGEEPGGALPVISEAGTKLQWELGTYRHHQSRLLEPLYVKFRQADNIANFTITYEIQKRNEPDPFKGKLHVLIDIRGNKAEN